MILSAALSVVARGLLVTGMERSRKLGVQQSAQWLGEHHSEFHHPLPVSPPHSSLFALVPGQFSFSLGFDLRSQKCPPFFYNTTQGEGEGAGRRQVRGGARVTCLERRRRDVRRCQLTQPQCCPATISDPSRSPPPPSMSVAGAGPGPWAAGLDLRRRARLAVLEGVGAGRAPQDASDRRCCRCPRPLASSRERPEGSSPPRRSPGEGTRPG